MSLNQNVRFAADGGSHNPVGIIPQFKPGRFLTPGNGPPAADLGTLYDEYVDLLTGIEYIQNTEGVWDPVINWSTGVPPADPLAVSELDVNTIKGNATESVQIDLGTAGVLSMGPSGNLGAVQVQGATAQIILNDGAGESLSIVPSSMQYIGASVFNVIGNGVTVTSTASPGHVYIQTVAGDVNIQPTGDLNMTADNAVMTGQFNANLLTTNGAIQVAATGGGLSLSGDPVTMTGTYIDVSGQDLRVGQLTGSSAIGIAATTGLSCSGSSVSLTSNTTNVTVSSAVDINLVAASSVQASTSPFWLSNGTGAAPSLSFINDTNSGLFSAAADTLGFSAGGSSRVTLSTTNINPVTNNAIDLGTGALAYKDIYSVNLLNVTSDRNAKKDIKSLGEEFGLDLCNSLTPVSFRMIDGDDKMKLGFIAQDVEKNIDGVGRGVKSDDYDVVVKSNEGKYMMKYDALIPVLCKSIQELHSNVCDLQNKFENEQKMKLSHASFVVNPPGICEKLKEVVLCDLVERVRKLEE